MGCGDVSIRVYVIGLERHRQAAIQNHRKRGYGVC